MCFFFSFSFFSRPRALCARSLRETSARAGAPRRPWRVRGVSRESEDARKEKTKTRSEQESERARNCCEARPIAPVVVLLRRPPFPTSTPPSFSSAGPCPPLTVGASKPLRFAHGPTNPPLKLSTDRGTFRSKPWADVVSEARSLVASGALELCLVAEDTNQYGSDRRDGASLALLLRELAGIEGLRWIRLLYCYPSYFSDELIEEIATNEKVAKYIDIPLQHAHNLTLLAMNRPPAAHTRTLLQKLRDRIPGLALRTTFICGFPGETDEAHAELVEFAREMSFERMGAFAYSPEDGTPAASYPDQVDEDVRSARRDELVSLQQDVGAAFAESLVGREVEVLIDGYDDDDDDDDEGGRPRQLIGRTQWDAPDVDPLAFVSSEWLCDAEARERWERESASSSSPAPFEPSRAPPRPGMMVRCVVTSASLFDLEVTPIEVVADSWAGVEEGAGAELAGAVS